MVKKVRTILESDNTMLILKGHWNIKRIARESDVLLSCISQILANFAAEKPCGPEKCPVYLKLPWIGNVSSKVKNQISKAITSCYYAVKPRVVYNPRVMLPSGKKDCVPTTQKSCCL